jgi:hypothetical protein
MKRKVATPGKAPKKEVKKSRLQIPQILEPTPNPPFDINNPGPGVTDFPTEAVEKELRYLGIDIPHPGWIQLPPGWRREWIIMRGPASIYSPTGLEVLRVSSNGVILKIIPNEEINEDRMRNRDAKGGDEKQDGKGSGLLLPTELTNQLEARCAEFIKQYPILQAGAVGYVRRYTEDIAGTVWKFKATPAKAQLIEPAVSRVVKVTKTFGNRDYHDEIVVFSSIEKAFEWCTVEIVKTKEKDTEGKDIELEIMWPDCEWMAYNEKNLKQVFDDLEKQCRQKGGSRGHGELAEVYFECNNPYSFTVRMYDVK